VYTPCWRGAIVVELNLGLRSSSPTPTAAPSAVCPLWNICHSFSVRSSARQVKVTVRCVWIRNLYLLAPLLGHLNCRVHRLWMTNWLNTSAVELCDDVRSSWTFWRLPGMRKCNSALCASQGLRSSLFHCDRLLQCSLDVTAAERFGFEKLDAPQSNKTHI
jgi:hypothetical protein